MHRFTRAYGAAKLALHANQPTMLCVGGVVVMAAAAVLACKKTVDLEQVIAPHVEQLELIKAAENTRPDMVGGGKYGSENAQGDRIVTYRNITFATSKHYAVPALLFVGGAVMVFRGHHVLQQRNAALAVAFTTLKSSFDAYRARVVSDQGQEADQRYMNGHIHTAGNDQYGPYQVTTRDWEQSDKDPYNRVFSQKNSSQWQNDLGSNKHFVASQQRFAQQILNRQGYLYLADVYQALGFVETDISRVVGWKINYLADGTKDIPIVDFGIDKKLPDDWKYGLNREIYLDFNCQGLIVGGKVQKMLEAAQ